MAITINGSGITSSEIASNTITSGNLADGTITNADINASAAIAGSKVDGSFGKVLQVVHVNKVDGYASSTATWQTITGMTASITPSSITSKILLTCVIQMGGANTWGGSHFRMKRDSTVLTVGTQGGHQVNAHVGGLKYYSGHGLDSRVIIEYDSPSTTSSVTYQLEGYPEQDGSYGVVYINSSNQPSTGYSSNGVSSIVLMEIAA
jgi:hypothetical protein